MIVCGLTLTRSTKLEHDLVEDFLCPLGDGQGWMSERGWLSGRLNCDRLTKRLLDDSERAGSFWNTVANLFGRTELEGLRPTMSACALSASRRK